MISVFGVCPIVFTVLLLQAIQLFASEDILSANVGYKVLIDAGSTGSRVYIYKYNKDSPWNSVNELSHKRLHPALSTFVNDYEGLAKQLNIFIRFAKYYIEEHEWEVTDIALKATAGLRSVSNEHQAWLIDKVRNVLQTSGFRCNPTDTRVISGKEEALYGLLAVNAAFIASHELLSIGAADLGGSSTQISFSVPSQLSAPSSSYNYISNLAHVADDQVAVACPVDFELSLLATFNSTSTRNEQPPSSKLFSRSINGLGLISAMEAVIDTQLNMLDGELDTAHDLDVDPSETATFSPDDAAELEGEEYDSAEECAATNATNSAYGNGSSIFAPNPCIAPGAPFPYLQGGREVDLHGSGSFEECLVLVDALLLKHAQVESRCMAQVRPRLIVGMDNLPKVLEIMYLAREAHVSPRQVRLAGEKLCRRSWPEILLEFPTFMPYRAQRACFGATYVYALLTRVYHLAEEDETSFLPLEVHREYTLGWPLGASIFSALGLDASHLVDLNPDEAPAEVTAGV